MDLSTTVLSSTAKSRLVRALSYSDQPFSLRQLSSVTSLNVHAVDEAARALLKEKILLKKKRANMTLFSLNADRSSYTEVSGIASLMEQALLKSSPILFNRTLADVINWNEELVSTFIAEKTK